jgi:hypothetical protein
MYTAEEIIEFFKSTWGIKKTRKRIYIDPRNYVLAVIYDRFNYTEEELAVIFDMDRSTINYGRKLPYYYVEVQKNEQYLENVELLLERFPHKFKKYELGEERTVMNSLYLKGIPAEVFNPLRERAQMLNIRVDTFVKMELKKLVKKWEQKD